MNDRERILEKLSEISVELEKDMLEIGWIGRTVTLKYKLDTYQGEVKSTFSVIMYIYSSLCSLYSC